MPHGLQPIQKTRIGQLLFNDRYDSLFKMLKNDGTQLLEQPVDIGVGGKSESSFSTHTSMDRLADRLSVCRDDSAA